MSYRNHLIPITVDAADAFSFSSGQSLFYTRF